MEKQTRQVVPISGFGISGFRTLQDVTVRTNGPVTVVCGPNNVGKSSFLYSLYLYPTLVSVLRGKNVREDPTCKNGVQARLAIALHSTAFYEEISENVKQGRAEGALKHIQENWPEYLWVTFLKEDERWNIDIDGALGPVRDAIRQIGDAGKRDRVHQTVINAFGDAGGLNGRWLSAVAKRCLPEVTVTPIPDIRRTAEKPLDDPDLFSLAQANVRHTGRYERVEQWADQLERILRDVFGDDVRYEVRPVQNSGDFRLLIDGEENLKLDQVGAGVREVVAIAHAALKEEGTSVLTIEEPENCLHPVAVKRLIYSLSKRAGVQLFVSTHASAVINSNPDSVLHLTREGATTTSREVEAASDRYEAVRSLGYSPADLVLTPCAIWVEGPSDRLYLTAWLDAYGLTEGIDYQVMFFGGALAAHVSVAADTLPRSALAAIRNLGRYCAIIVDSDREKPHAPPKPYVKRFRDELDGDNYAHLLVTNGREIENYLPIELANRLRRKFGAQKIGEGRYRYKRIVDPKLNKKVSKVRFAEKALTELAGDVPSGAKRDIKELAEFIKGATVP